MENLLNWTRAVLTITPLRWENMAQNLPVELLTRQPAAGEWSAMECLQHILDAEMIFIARLNYFLAGQNFPAFNPDQEGTRLTTMPSPAEMTARFTLLRKESLKALEEITPHDLERRVRHAQLGMVSLGEMVHEWGAHDFNHTIQAERAIMQPFILGSGPWQDSFRDHLVK